MLTDTDIRLNGAGRLWEECEAIVGLSIKRTARSAVSAEKGGIFNVFTLQRGTNRTKDPTTNIFGVLIIRLLFKWSKRCTSLTCPVKVMEWNEIFLEARLPL